MKDFLKYSKNRFLFSLLKIAIIIALAFIVNAFMFINPIKVKAATLSSFKFLNRTSLPFGTFYDPGEFQEYGQDYFVFSGSDIPSYIYVKVCSTGYLTPNPKSVTSAGSISFLGMLQISNSCSVQGYTGRDYVMIYRVLRYEDAGNGNYGITFAENLKSNASYTIVIDVKSIDYSTDLIYNLNDAPFDDSGIISGLDDLKEQQQQTNEKLDDLNKNQQETNDKLGDLNDSLTDETPPDAPDFSDINVASDKPISDLILMPINFLNRLINGFNSSCSAYSIDFGIFGSDYVLTLPCLNLQSYLGSGVWHTIDLLICFFMCYNIGMLAVKMFNDFTSMRDTYDSLYEPQHTYKPKHGGGN